MERRLLIALLLSALVVAGWTILFAPHPVPPDPAAEAGVRAPAGSDGAQGTSPAAANEGNNSGVAPSPDGAAESAEVRAEKREAPEGTPPAIVETDFFRIAFASAGGQVRSWTLKNYLDHEGKPYELVRPESANAGIYPLQFRVADKAIEGLLNTRARFVIDRASGELGTDATPAPADGKPAGVNPADAAPSASATPAAPDAPGSVEEIRMIFADGRGLEATKTLRFHRDSYLVELSASIKKNGEPVPAKILWGPGIGTPHAGSEASGYGPGDVVADLGAGLSHFAATSVTAPAHVDGAVRWVGLEEQYFAAVLMPPDGLTGAEVVPSFVTLPPPPPPAPLSPSADNAAGGSGASGTQKAPAKPEKPQQVTLLSIAVPTDATYTLFAGPKDYDLLRGLGGGLESLVQFTPAVPLIGPIIGILAKGLHAALRALYGFIPNYGIGIIIITTIVRILFYPITQRAMVKMRAVQQQMQKVQPKVKAIQEKYRKSKDAQRRTKQNEEIMALYQREGINPMASLGGCLPLLLQLPILYGFYRVLTISIELRQAPFFGWITDLAQPDPYRITPILMGVTMFIQQKMAMTQVTDPQQRAQQRIMLIMPIVFTFSFLGFPSGLVLYWFVNNILGIVQQILINKQAAVQAAQSLPAAGKA